MKGLCSIGFAFALAITACGAEDDKFTDCHIGELTGTWRTHYSEIDGDCGPIADETGIFDPNSPPPPGCTYTAQSVSTDKCRADLGFTCPTTDGNGTQAWVLVVRQTSSGTLEGTGTAQVNHPSLGTCRSTYDMTITKL